MKKILFIGLLITSIINAQIITLTPQELEQKIVLDTKVKTSSSYLKVAGGVMAAGIATQYIRRDISIFAIGIVATGVFTTPYHITRHLVYVHKRNKFYKKHNISKNK
jgi:uncharacterized membrane protein